jgi:hypothetical protein
MSAVGVRIVVDDGGASIAVLGVGSVSSSELTSPSHGEPTSARQCDSTDRNRENVFARLTVTSMVGLVCSISS